MAEVLDSTSTSIIPTSCRGCGAPVAQLTRMRREYCSEDCRLSRKARLRKEPKAPPICAICGMEFLRASGRQKVCSGCRVAKARAYSREYTQANRPVILAKAKDAYWKAKTSDPEKMQRQKREWGQKNRLRLNEMRRSDKGRKRAAAYMRRRYATSHSHAVHMRMASAVYQALREKKAGRKWEALVGYSVVDLVRHLERQFEAGMSWQNMGEWHIDHIIPKSSFHYESDQDDEFRACWALTNLRPLWSEDNQKKHSKRLLLV